jgi:hypothetical protein
VELINATRMRAGYTMGREPDGRDLIVVVVKGTFVIPRNAEPVRLADEQAPFTLADSFTDSPGFSAPVYEMDFSPRKDQCDVLVVGSAYAPDGRPATRVPVGIRVNGMTKSFVVVGERSWTVGVTGVRATPPMPFTTMPISYDRAFGGVDNRDPDPSRHAAFSLNPVGRGFYVRQALDGQPLPNTEEHDRPVDRPAIHDYRPMALGPIGRSWEPRRQYAGTYNERWLEEEFPFLPHDFDDRYYQAAPLDQQFPKGTGAHSVTLLNLTPDGRRDFVLPQFEAPIRFIPKRGPHEECTARPDTIVIEPDLGRVMISWRVARPLRNSMFELAQVVVGRTGSDWWQRRESIAFPIPLIPTMV